MKQGSLLLGILAVFSLSEASAAQGQASKSATEHSATQHSTPEHSVPQHSTPQHSAPQHSTSQHSAPHQTISHPSTTSPSNVHQEMRTHVAPSFARTPSMSRSDYRPNTQPITHGSTERAKTSSLKFNTQHHPSSSPSNAQHAAVANTHPAQEDIRQHLEQVRPRTLNKQITTQKQQKFKTSFSKQRGSNQEVSRRTRNHILQTHPAARSWFNDQFFDEHHYYPFYHHHGDNWWRRMGWNGISNWLPYSWSYPVYYDDDGYPVPLSSSTDNYTEPDSVASDYSYEEDDADWQPLGVFVSAQNAAQAAYSHAFVQLAINKDGDIAGTYYNSATNQTHLLEGMVDQKTQQVVWKVADNPDSPFMTTGLYNLTQDVATVQVHFPDDSEQDWVLVRLDN